MWPPAGIHAASLDPRRFEAAITAAGLSIVQCLQLHGEARERLEEDGVAASSKQLLRVSRLLRNRAAYEERFGTVAYEYLLTDSPVGRLPDDRQAEPLDRRAGGMRV
jgi:hypothetical protein